jgi:hypothetical protein
MSNALSGSAETGVEKERRQHVVKKTDFRGDVNLSPVQIEGQGDVRLLCLSFYL